MISTSLLVPIPHSFRTLIVLIRVYNEKLGDRVARSKKYRSGRGLFAPCAALQFRSACFGTEQYELASLSSFRLSGPLL